MLTMLFIYRLKHLQRRGYVDFILVQMSQSAYGPFLILHHLREALDITDGSPEHAQAI